MKKRMLTLILIAAAAVLMIAGYFIYKAVSVPQNEAKDIELFKAEGINKIACVYKGESLSFEKKQGVWTYEPDEGYPLNTAYVRDMENALQSVTASQTLDSGSSEEYGLDDPTCEISAVTDDGREFQCELGNDNDTVNIVYMRYDGAIYAVGDDFSMRFRHTLLEMASRDKLLSVEASDVTEFSLTNSNGSFSVKQYADGAPGAYSKELKWLFSDGSYGDSETMKQLIQTVADMRPAACVSYQPNSEELEKYGLNQPVCTTDIKFKGGELDLRIGQKNNDGEYAVYLPNEKLVYTFDPEGPEALTKYKQTDCLNRFVFLMDYSEIASIKIDGGGFSKNIIFDDKNEAWDFYYALSTMRAEGFAQQESGMGGDIVLTVYINKSTEFYTMDFSKYNEDFYSVCFQDGKIKLVNKRDVEAFYH